MTQNQATGGGAAALNTSFANTSISAISDTMITYEGQPAKTRFLTPYFKKDPKAPLLEEIRNRGLYGEGTLASLIQHLYLLVSHLGQLVEPLLER